MVLDMIYFGTVLFHCGACKPITAKILTTLGVNFYYISIPIIRIIGRLYAYSLLNSLSNSLLR
jgi:hypothetical protein